MAPILGLDANHYKEITIGELEEIMRAILKEQPDFRLYLSFRASEGIPLTLNSTATAGHDGWHSRELYQHFRTKRYRGKVAESGLLPLFAYIIQQYNALPVVAEALQKFNTDEKLTTGDSTIDQSPYKI